MVILPMGQSSISLKKEIHYYKSMTSNIDNFRLLLLLLKNVSSARLREGDIHPNSPKTPAPQHQPIDRKKRKGKIVQDYCRDTAA